MEKEINPKKWERKNLEGIYVLTEHWQSDLFFFDDEIKFLKLLMEKYFLWFIEEINIEYSRVLAGKLTSLEKRRAELVKKVSDHQKEISRPIQNNEKVVGAQLLDNHESLEVLWSNFIKDFRVVKKEMFRLAEEGLNFNKGSHLL
ncbi:hypothetical protein QWY93_14505 [Echinicola jeungdonensis]|uniref:Uncharacterized protein n=1 Tax=Echinicola jeungdonensis TaxID=709343 RepID=A0ABV5J960_9BACT|nr:hypothetical protein [Echinicola jeungdonensis]MDN3670531.1 hypothetical protein [Echinicola jeungdonensis]